MRIPRRLRRQIGRLPPYPALILVAAPLAVVEPLKLAILVIAGKGHWITGTVAMIGAYAVSLFVTHWLFKIVKPKLLKLRWFAILWAWWSRGATGRCAGYAASGRSHAERRAKERPWSRHASAEGAVPTARQNCTLL